MKSCTRILAIISLAAILVMCVSMPAAGLGKDLAAAATKKKPAAQKAKKKVVSPDNVSAGGKTLSQWRALFGENSQPVDVAPSLLKSNSILQSHVAEPPSKPAITQQIQHLPLVPKERAAAARILGDARKAYWTRLAVIANNMANVDTVGYKRNRTLLEGKDALVGMEGNDWSRRGQLAAAGISACGGGPVLTIQTDFRQGRLEKTGRMLDIAIEGKGFLQVINQQTGETIYTRAGNLSVNNNGSFTVGPGAKGWLIEPSINIPQDATAITFKSDGSVYVAQPGTSSLTQVGQLQLAFFINPEGLQRMGGKLFGETDASGCTIQANPGQDSCGVIRQGHLERSNVTLAEEEADWKATVGRIQALGQKVLKSR